ncbi:MAG: DNA polymerase III subunit beta [candidate division Zixibacteria bacterium]|nr:DNA polymerase III subunit beta [candidate division Zixibacteria bacterium]
MKFSLPKSRLTRYLQSVLSVVPAKSTLPILSNILLECLDKKLKISATDLDVTIMATIEADVSKKGSAVIPGRMLFDIVKDLPESEVTFEGTANRIELKVPNGSYKLGGVSPDEFPELPVVNIKKQVTVEAESLINMIKRTTFACSNDETRPALNGVLWQTKGDKMIMVATDGHRLARVSVENKKLKGLNDDVIIPPKVLDLIPKFISSDKDEIGIIFEENRIVFNLDDIVVSSRLIEGPYPNYEAVIPEKSDKKMVIARTDLASSVRRVSILSNSLTHQVKFGVKNNQLVLSTTNSDVGGEAKENLVCEYKGETIEIGYNAGYVNDILNKLESDEVIFELSTPVSAGLIYSTDISKEDYICLLMPLRLTE